MTGAGEDRIGRLLAERGLLEQGRSREAADVFCRVLLLDPGHDEARRGLERARAAAAEQDRIDLARLDEARRAVERGDREGARALLEEVLRQGGDRERALALLDRLDGRPGRLEGPRSEAAPHAEPAAAPVVRKARSRLAFIVACAAVFAVLGAGMAGSWEQLVARLVRAPSPSSEPLTPSSAAAPSAGEQALAETRHLIEQGDLAGALVRLDRISAEEPAYPFARQLRVQEERDLRKRGAGR